MTIVAGGGLRRARFAINVAPIYSAAGALMTTKTRQAANVAALFFGATAAIAAVLLFASGW